MDVFCPQCGYNLHGIPELRCPECGFGYQHDAIRKIAVTRAEQRLRLYRRVVWLGFLGVLCAAVPLSHWLWHGAIARSAEVIVRFGSVLASLPFALASSSGALWKTGLIGLCAPFLLVLAAFAPKAFCLLAAAMLALAAIFMLGIPSSFPHAALSLEAAERRQLRWWCVTAWVSLAAAIVGLLTALSV